MQLKPDQWRPFEAEQEMALDRVEFSWRARFPLASLVALHVHDWYRAGEGALEVRLFGLPLKRLRGEAVTKGEAMRYLAELPWAAAAMAHNMSSSGARSTRGRSRLLRASPPRAWSFCCTSTMPVTLSPQLRRPSVRRRQEFD